MWKFLRALANPKPRQYFVPAGMTRIAYGCEKGGKVITEYPTEAAMLHDPIFVRSEGAHSVGRLEESDGKGGWIVVSAWRPVFTGDLATFRYSQFGGD